MNNSKLKINVGCGDRPTKGWINVDGSLSVLLAKINFLPRLLLKLGIILERQYNFIKYSRENNILYGDITKRIPFENNSCDVVYCCHVLEHLPLHQRDKFLLECKRVLIDGGILRIAVPDLELINNAYILGDLNADDYLKRLRAFSVWSEFKSLRGRIRVMLTGCPSVHKWMYDQHSLMKLLRSSNFREVKRLKSGDTMIQFPGELNLRERESESLYVEAKL